MASLGEVNQKQVDEIGLLDIFVVLRGNIRLLVLFPVSVGIFALGASFWIKPTFTAVTSFLPPQQQQSAAAAMLQGLGALGGLAGAANGIKNPADQYVAFIKSRTVQNALVERFDLQKKYGSELSEDARRSLEGSVRIAAGKDGLIRIEVEDNDPAFAAQLANAHIEELRVLLSRLAVTEAQQRRAFYEKQLEQAKAKLNLAQRVLQGSGIKEGALRAEPRMAAEAYARLKAEVTSAQVRIQSMRTYLADQAPEVRLAQSNLAALRSQLQAAENEDSVSAKDEYIEKYRDFKYQEALFEMYAKQFELAKLDEARDGAVIQVVDEAQPPERKSKPKKALIAILATLVAGFAATFFVLGRLYWVRLEGDIREAEKKNLLQV